MADFPTSSSDSDQGFDSETSDEEWNEDGKENTNDLELQRTHPMVMRPRRSTLVETVLFSDSDMDLDGDSSSGEDEWGEPTTKKNKRRTRGKNDWNSKEQLQSSTESTPQAIFLGYLGLRTKEESQRTQPLVRPTCSTRKLKPILVETVLFSDSDMDLGEESSSGEEWGEPTTKKNKRRTRGKDDWNIKEQLQSSTESITPQAIFLGYLGLGTQEAVQKIQRGKNGRVLRPRKT